MALSTVNMKLYLRVDHTADDLLIKGLLAAATQYIKNTSGKTLVNTDDPIEDDPVFQTCLKMLVAHWYENRGVEIQGNPVKISYSVDAMVNHISLCGEYT